MADSHKRSLSRAINPFAAPSMATYRLLFLIEGKDNFHSIRVPSTIEVEQLTELIYDQVKHSFVDSISPRELLLSKINKPIASFQEDLSKYKPGPQEGIVLVNPVQQVSDIWHATPSKEYVHIFVRATQLGPGHSRNNIGSPIDSVVIQRFQKTFIKVKKFGNWTIHDVESNGVTSAKQNQIPVFIMEFQQMLAMKRTVPVNLCAAIQAIQSFPSNEYCRVMAEPILPVMDMNEAELVHLMHVASIDPLKWWLRKGGSHKFKQPEVSWLLLYPMASPYDPDEEDDRGITVKVGEDPWPFLIVVRDVNKVCRSYKPKNDLTVLKYSLPRLLLEVNSTKPDEPRHDEYCMLLQGASMVRFANECLESYKANKIFILIAIYISIDGEAYRYIMYQDRGRDPNLEKVCYRKRVFSLREQVDRIHFILELYNFMSALRAEPYNQTTIAQIEEFQSTIMHFDEAYGLDSLTSGPSKRRRRSKKDNQGSDQHGSGTSDRAMERLKTYGYILKPDYIEDKGGLLAPLIRPPPHIRTVYRSIDTTQEELIAKHVEEQSVELEVFEYLRKIQSDSVHIISLLDTIPTDTGNWLIFPKMCTLKDYLFMHSNNPQLRGPLTQLGCDLIGGLSYLHDVGVAHLDVKPGNLVYTDSFRLQIIDFDTAVRVGSMDETIEGVYGTEGWMAPEIQPQATFNPIRADRWSCGKVLLFLLKKCGAEDGELGRFAKQLMNDNPLHRPSLVEWPEPADATLYDDGDEDEVKDGKKVSETLVEDDDINTESVDDGLENPIAGKRPRVDGLELDERHGATRYHMCP